MTTVVFFIIKFRLHAKKSQRLKTYQPPKIFMEDNTQRSCYLGQLHYVVLYQMGALTGNT